MSLGQIPISVWKMFSETIPTLFTISIYDQNSERFINNLAKIINSNLNLFVFEREPNQTYEEFQSILKKYKSLSTWFLGKFFHLLTCENLSRKHDTFIEIQLGILTHLSKTDLHFYSSLVAEYYKAFGKIIDFIKSENEKDLLYVFVPEILEDLRNEFEYNSIPIEIHKNKVNQFVEKVLKFIAVFLKTDAAFGGYKTATIRVLDDLLFLMAEGEIKLKLLASKIFLNILEDYKKASGVIQLKIDMFHSYFEQIIYNLYNNSESLATFEKELFENVLNEFLLMETGQKHTKITEFIIKKGDLGFQIGNNIKLCYNIADNEEFKNFTRLVIRSYNLQILHNLKIDILNEIKRNQLGNEGISEIKLFDDENNNKWSIFRNILINSDICKENQCNARKYLNFYKKLTENLIEIKIDLKNKPEIVFFDTTTDFFKIIAALNKHFNSCTDSIDPSLLFDVILNFAFISNQQLILLIVFDVLTYNSTKFLLSASEFNKALNCGQYKKELDTFFKYLKTLQIEKNVTNAFLMKYLKMLSTGIVDLRRIEDIESGFYKILKSEQNDQFKIMVVENLPDLYTLFPNTSKLDTEILTPTLTSSNQQILTEIMKSLSKIICISSTDFTKKINGDFSSEIICEKCNEKFNASKSGLIVNFNRIDFDLNVQISFILKNVLKGLASNNVNLKLAALDILPACCSHISKFNTENVTEFWMKNCEDANEEVRRKVGAVLVEIIKMNKTSLSKQILRIIFGTLTKATKTSLRETNISLQRTLIDTFHHLILLNYDHLLTYIIPNLVYFIMVPTSHQQSVAINQFHTLSKLQDFHPKLIYKQHRTEICKIIADLCHVNKVIADMKFSTSLSQISETFGYYNSKDFVARECSTLLPFFISKQIHSNLNDMVTELALMLDTDIVDLLSTMYGNVFLYAFLNETKDDFKKYTAYLESTTKMSGPSLRRNNVWYILNELLLNFHTNRDKVLLALTLLADEDGCSSVEEYLRDRLLGLLKQFDLKLVSNQNLKKKDSILLSLADLFLYMGAKNLTPLRFKIIAMLRTNDYNVYPELICRVWEAFIKSCDVEVIGPQLAIIFVSLLPLLDKSPNEINAIFSYLVVENEKHMGDYVKDLFFVEDSRIHHTVSQVIRKHVKIIQECGLKEKIRIFLKYMNHESLEVRIKSMKHLKLVMEKGRKELDEMILGYNGIDEIIVELIDSLTVMCREKDDALKLAVGEVFGELGAVEPEHLPRRYSDNSRFFTFYIDDDCFVVNALAELIKALQSEKNTVNVDRFAMAIQEILKKNNISPDEGSSSKKRIWQQFSETQQEIMRPFLNSHYCNTQLSRTDFPSPIYGSSDGSSFASWLTCWTQSLISCLSKKHQSLLTDCFPAMRQDRRLLMQFLPHIVMHAIIDDYTNKEKVYVEIKTVTSSFNVKKALNDDILDIRPIRTMGNCHGEPYTPEEVKQAQCAKVVFVILDFLDRWLMEWQWQKGSKGRDDLNFKNIKDFLNRFCKYELAKANYYCGEFPRALMYLEDYLSANPSEISPNLAFLAEIYAKLDEGDGVQGVTALQTSEPSIDQRILALRVVNKLADAASCYEQIKPLKLRHIRGLIKCYLDLEHVNTALNFAQGAHHSQIDFGNNLLELQAEPLWRLGKFDELDSLVNDPKMGNNRSWDVEIGRAMIKFKKGDREGFENIMNDLKLQQVNLLGATSLEEGVYQQGYCHISKLHVLNELQQVEKVTSDLLLKRNDNSFVKNLVEGLQNEWELRIKVVQESVRIKEPILCLRRVAIEQSKRIVEEKAPSAVPLLDNLLGECWILSSKTARTAGILQQAYTYNLKAEPYAPLKLFLEKAKLHWLREEHQQALRILQRGVEAICPGDSQNLSLEKKKICAEAKLLIATYNESIANVDTDINVNHYKEAKNMYEEWETSWVSLARFYDRIFDTMSDTERDDVKGSGFQIHIINYFLKSLQYGSKFVYQSMPRLLSIWFDYGTRLLDVTQSQIREERKKNLLKMTKLIDNGLEKLPSYVFLTAFSQLVSRICHPQKEVYKELTSIIIKLLLHYPQQTLWMIISVVKSSYAVRARRCAEIFNDSRLKSVTIAKLVKDFTNLAEKLIELCNKDIPPDVTSTKVSVLLRSLPRMFTADFSEIMIPTHQFRKLVLPNPDFTNSQHNPFPNRYVHIIGIEEEVTVLHSLQRPRKITFRGSDGKHYIQMLKPKDDLRKDFRLMEFNDIVNQLLSLEPESRQRRLNIRLYSVVPLNEECGLIEWIPNLVGLRPILMSIYKQRGQGMGGRELKDASCNIRDPLSKKREVFNKILIPRHPPVLGDWFRRTFPDAQSWFIARTAYTRTTAVMSMVGYILGLGDRHGENILFDSTCGDTVHVDFNCLFNKGESFEWPERVPFRLTHNMIAAMGPLGVEGVFRKSCACTLRVLRTNANTLMSIVTPFVYDPLVSWPRNVPASAQNTAERTNELAVEYIKNIQLRLQGQMKTRSRTFSIALSIDGQTDNLIKEARSEDNLCQMYIGWGAYH